MERVSKLVAQLKREGIVLKSVDAGGGLGIDYHGGSFDAAAKVRRVRRGHSAGARRL
jgi:diaminopimelate decarboxylase